MNGRPRPRRTSAQPDLPPSRRRRTLLIAPILALSLVLAVALLTAGCGSDPVETSTTASAPATTAATAPSTTASTVAEPAPSAFPVTVTDDNGSSVTIPAEPVRIVSTAPANTETLFAIGVGERVVGVTSLCDYPPEAAAVAKIGDYQANTEAIMALSPDLVVGYSGNEEALAPVQAAGSAVLIMNPMDLEQIFANIATIGSATGATAEAAEVVDSIKAQIAAVTDMTATLSYAPKVFYALDNTLWTAGPGSFVDQLLMLVGAINIGAMDESGGGGQPYFQLTPEQLVAVDPDVVLLPGSVYSSADEFTGDSRFAGLTAVKEGRVFVIDDVVVTRPGPRIGEGVKILAEAVHPGVF